MDKNMPNEDGSDIVSVLATPSTDSTITSSIESVKKKRLTTHAKRPGNAKKRKTVEDDLLANWLGDGTQFNALRNREVEAREKEASARLIEAEANSNKAKKEIDILKITEAATLLHQ